MDSFFFTFKFTDLLNSTPGHTVKISQKLGALFPLPLFYS